MTFSILGRLILKNGALAVINHIHNVDFEECHPNSGFSINNSNNIKPVEDPVSKTLFK